MKPRIIGMAAGCVLGIVLGKGTGIVGGAFGAVPGALVFMAIGTLWGFSAGADFARLLERIRIRYAVKQVFRGCGTLPHVGSHPGTLMMLLLICVSALAGGQSMGALGALGGAIFMLVFMGPIYLFGAYDRAQASDRISAQKHLS